MTHPNAIHRNQSRTRSQAGQPALGRCAPSIDHDETSSAVFSSLPPHHLGEGFGPRHFLRFHGAGSRVAARPLADQTLAPGTFQSITERGPVHSSDAFPETDTSCALEPRDGAHGSVPVQAGELPLQRGERPDVGGS